MDGKAAGRRWFPHQWNHYAMQRSVHSASRVRVVLSPALGDSLLMMIVAHNLRANRIAVTVFGRQASEMAAWFPEVDIRPDLDGDRLGAPCPVSIQ
ncbi:MAG: hypothetical protein WDN30_09140 [Pararobbsia sp.]